MRGKEVDSLRINSPCRITPACAGKSGFFRLLHCIVWDHPRVCGEKRHPAHVYFNDLGSPPRMRGKVQLQPGQPAALGITPAYAGKSKNLPALVCGNGDHPRVCGEKRKDFETANRKKGSPPRMRGKGCMFCCSPAKVGITPAYAGKSLLCMDFCPAYRDHPRVCGEKFNPIA